MPDLELTETDNTGTTESNDVDKSKRTTVLPISQQAVISEDIIFTRELNENLRARIQNLSTENGSLRRALEEAERKLHSKGEAPSVTQSLMSLEKSSEAATTKIVELSKRCRERTAEVEVLKSKCKQLEEKLASKEAELESERHELKRLKSDPSTESHSNQSVQSKEDEDQVRYLSERLQQSQAKLYESKNTCAALRQELNKAHKLLCSEVGENVSLSGITGSQQQPCGWRGRAEQIRLLQQKVAELQSRLSDYEGTQKVSVASMERKNLATLRNIEKERRQLMENSAKELRQAEVALETSKRKLEASKARIKVLENELNALKGHVALLSEKKSHDDTLIETLNNRLRAAESRNQERESEIKHREDKLERECANLKNDMQSSQLQIARLRRRLEEREIEIERLREGSIGDSDQMRAQKSHRPRVVPVEVPRSPPQSSRSCGDPNEYVTLALAAEAERERLLELVAVLNRRIDKERSEVDMISESLRNEKSRSARLELKLRKLETERAGLVKVDTGYRLRFLSKTSKATEDFINTEQLRLKMELLEEECLALKARLDTVQQDKAEDLALYRRMLNQARKMFQDACRSKPPTTAGNRSIITI